ncbi:MAG: hypothetical protein ACI867_002124 [Glaciecola sp.]|jgi:hypothetical protein
MNDDSSSRSGKIKLLLVLAALVAGSLAMLKKQREAELDEALWEEPRAL